MRAGSAPPPRPELAQARADSTRLPPLLWELRHAATSNPWILTAGANDDGAKLLLLLLLYVGRWT